MRLALRTRAALPLALAFGALVGLLAWSSRKARRGERLGTRVHDWIERELRGD